MRLFKIFSATTFLFISIIIFSPSASAIQTSSYEPTPNLITSPVIITGYSFVGGKVNYVQLYNSSDEVIDISDWQLQYTLVGQTTPQNLTTLHGLLKPSNYVLAADASATATPDFAYTMSPSPSPIVASLQLVPTTIYLAQTVTLKVDATTSYWQRNISTTTGDYLSTFAAFAPGPTFTLYVGGLYEIPFDPLLQVSEVLANARQCSPLETALDCGDYVKLFNPTDQPINLSQFRLRTGYQGQTATSSNTFTMSGVIEPGHYAAITASADGHSVALTNSGGYVWIEDVYGLQRYDSSVQEYADGGSDSKKGQAWSYDSSDDSWKWTTQPTPSDTPNVFPVATIQPIVITLAPCKDGQYRSEETNRGRTFTVTASATLAPCDEGKERNPATNRCRNIVAAAQELTPCASGQERNPDTNRCRKVASTSVPPAAFAVEPIKDSGKVFAGWWALGGVLTLGVGYGVWEWRREITSWLQKVMRYTTFSK